jgi:hypothetical protein
MLEVRKRLITYADYKKYKSYEPFKFQRDKAAKPSNFT